MKRLINPTVEELDTLYELARNTGKVLVEVMDATNSGIHGWDYLGQPNSNQIVYLLSKKEFAMWKHVKCDVLYGAAA